MSRAEILRNVPLRALLVAEVVSTTGSQMTWLALPWFVLTTTGSPARMTFVMIAELVGATAAGLPAGVLLQRLGARRTMLGADAVRAPLMLLVPALHWTGHLSFVALLALAIPQALRSRVVGAYRFVNYGTRPVGALLGGILGSAIGLRETMWISVVGATLGVLFLFASPMPTVREQDLA